MFVFSLIKKSHGVPSSTVLNLPGEQGWFDVCFPPDTNNKADVIGNILWT